MKKETLEEVAENFANSIEGISPLYRLNAKNTFIRGAKWQQEQDKNKYSDSDMTNYSLYILHNDVITPKEWLEKFKNK